jgi:putative sterol carrier protein
MTKSEMVTKLNAKRAWLPGKRVKVDFGEQGLLLLDGVGERVSEEDLDADTVVRIGWDDLQALKRRELDPMTALMQGKLRIEGDMANVMQLTTLLGGSGI